MKIRVKAKPNSKVNSIKQIEENYFEVRVTSPPEKGKANDKIIELLAQHLNVPKSRITLIRGNTGKEKFFEILQ